MKKVMEIFKRDISRLVKSPAAIIVAVGMCIIPALYAWFNIAANRDPYGNTAITWAAFRISLISRKS